MGHGLFWGLFLILVGLALILKFVFDLDIPVLRIALALFLILFGIQLLIRNRWDFRFSPHEHDIIFRETTIHGKNLSASEYNVIFGKALFDLTDIDSASLPKTIRINTIFGSTVVKVKADLPLKISGDAVFAGAKLAGDSKTVFGELSYTSRAYQSGADYLHLKSDVIFSAFEMTTDADKSD